MQKSARYCPAGRRLPQISFTGFGIAGIFANVLKSGLERFLDSGLIFDQCTLKNRPRIKACVIRPPETPSVFILFLNRKVNQ